MPSPTSSTRPTSRASIVGRTWRICSSRIDLISSARKAMTAPLDQLGADRVELRADAGVIDPVADADDQAAQEFRIDMFMKDRLGLSHRPHVVAQPPPL